MPGKAFGEGVAFYYGMTWGELTAIRISFPWEGVFGNSFGTPGEFVG